MTLPGRIQFRLVPCSDLSAESRDQMFELMSQHFAGVSPEQFARDLSEKSFALLLRSGETLVGLSTLCAYSIVFEGEQLNVIYSGDTIVTPEAWGTTALPRAWVAGVEALRADLPPGRCFWLLLTSGFRTYRFLPVFWREFFPRYDLPTPPATQRLLDSVAAERFPTCFDPVAGIVRFSNPQRLRSGLANIPPGREHDSHIQFFLTRNPDHSKGDELVCLTELSADNLTAAGRRMTHPPSYVTARDFR